MRAMILCCGEYCEGCFVLLIFCQVLRLACTSMDPVATPNRNPTTAGLNLFIFRSIVVSMQACHA
jgi:hypothetical protein